jgi:sortase B
MKGEDGTEKQGKIKTAVLALSAVALMAVLVLSLYQGLKVYLPQKQEQERFSEIRQIAAEKSENQAESGLAKLAAHNPDFVGWLTVPDTEIDYPVVKPPADDPQYHLHRDFDKNESFAGTPFIGEGCDENSDVFIIYGHKMKAGTMFGTLDKFADRGWAEAHQEFTLETPTETRTYRVFAVFRTTVNSKNEYRYFDNVGNFNAEERQRIAEEMRSRSEIETDAFPSAGEQIVILSTCSYHTENGRFAVAAYRVDGDGR